MKQNVVITLSLHPLWVGLCFFIGGVVVPLNDYYWLIISFTSLTLLIIYLVFKQTSWTHYLVFICLFFIGNFIYNHQLKSHNDFFLNLDKKEKYILTGTVDSFHELQFKKYARSLILKNVTLSKEQSSEIVCKNVRLGIYANNCQDLQVDDKICLSGISIKKPSSTSYQQYLIKEGLITTVFLPNECKPGLRERPLFSIKRFIHNKKNEILTALKFKMSNPVFTFFSSLFLGNKLNNFHYEKTKEQFKRWGLSHYLARSGLHLILFIFLWQLLFRCLPLAYLVKHLLLVSLVMLYCTLSWPSLPFIRSCMSYCFYVFYILTNQQVDSLHLLTLVTWLIVIFNPMHIFSLDFQLSFGLTGALIWFSRTTNKTQ